MEVTKMTKEQFIEKYGEECYYDSLTITYEYPVFTDPNYGPVSKYYIEPVEPVYSGVYYVCK